MNLMSLITHNNSDSTNKYIAALTSKPQKSVSLMTEKLRKPNNAGDRKKLLLAQILKYSESVIARLMSRLI